MKKFFIIFLIFFAAALNPVYAEGDLWDNFGDQNAYGQKPVTDEEFDKALESKKGKPKKPKDRLLRNGEAFQESNETAFLTSIPKELPILLIPLNLELKNDAVLPVGHYQVMGEKKNGKVYLKLFQAHNMLASLEAVETNEDFGEEEINFVRLIDNGDEQAKIIYGSVDFNAYVVVRITK